MAIELRRTNGIMTWTDRREMNSIHAEARKAAARVQAAAYVTYVAVQQTGVLTQLESELVARAPLCEGRFRMLVDSIAIAAAAEIRELGWRSS